MQRELCDAFDRVDADPDVRAVVVTGSGRAFCAGADLGSGERTFSGGKRIGPRSRAASSTLRIFDCTKPVIAAVNGPAIGVGASMTLADGRAVRGAERDVRLRVHPPRHRARSVLVVVPPAARRHPDRARLADVGPHGLARPTRWPPGSCSTSPTTSSTAATEYARDLVARHRAGLGRADAPARVAHDRPSRRRPRRTASTPRCSSPPRPRPTRAKVSRRSASAAPPDFPMRVPDDLPAAYPWWEPDEWST